MSAIEVVDLVKTYGDQRALDGVSFRVEPGEVVAVLGPNGAGKTTAVEILEGHRTATSGTVRVLDHDPATAGSTLRDRIGIVLQSCDVEPQLTAREALTVYGGEYRNRQDPDALLELVGLGEAADRRIRTLSGGQQRRIDLALGLVGDPDVLFLDEPTTGFDPAARRQSWSIVEELTRSGTTVLLTTHYLDEAQHLADRVIVLAHGRIVAEGPPDGLLDDDGTAIRFGLPAESVDPVESLFGAVRGTVRGRNGRVEITTRTPTADLAVVCGWAAERGIELGGLEVRRRSLEDVYLELVGEGVDEDG